MSNLVCCCCTSFWKKGLCRLKLFIVGLVLVAGIAHGQDDRKVPISFVPPPLENATYSLGLYEAKSGRLVRRLQEIVPESAFTVGLNGFVTSWDGKDDEGKAVSRGKYDARGYAVGALKVEGVAVLGNDWSANDENLRISRIEGIGWVPLDDGFCVVAVMAAGGRELMRFSKDGNLIWRKSVLIKSANADSHYFWRLVPNALLVNVLTPGPPAYRASYSLADGGPGPTPSEAPEPGEGNLFNKGKTDREALQRVVEGKSHTLWGVSADGVCQATITGEVLRMLPREAIQPTGRATTANGFRVVGTWRPFQVSASTLTDLLYLLEVSDVEGVVRFRGVSLAGTKEEGGKPVSLWQTFVEREISASDSNVGQSEAASAVEITLSENPLTPGRVQKVRLGGTVDDKGSYLTTDDGLRLRPVSQRASLKTARLIKGKTVNSLLFYQYDGAAWDEFSIEGAKNMLAFDAGEIEMTADGEKTHPARAPEPPDL